MSLVEQLRKQRDESAGLNSMVVLSALLHALVLFVVFFSPSLPEPKRTFVPAYTVDLVTMAPASSEEVQSVGIPFGEEIGVEDRETAVAVRRPVDVTMAAPIERIRVQRRETSGELDEAIRQIQKRVTTASPSATAEKPGPPGPAQTAASDAGTDRMNVYYTELWGRIQERWALPETILADRNLEAVLAVTIARDGSIKHLVFEERSGNRRFDESAESAVRKAAPFPALPAWLNAQYIEVGIRFRPSDYR
ncbi:MAG TPA: TonB family protein [Deltaproteobacteria bacterium]|nr:TonB family protein [Deltaproteobacteria bacterium]